MKISPQDVSDWARMSPYLEQALDLEPHERAAWLKSLETTQPEVAREVAAMLGELAGLDARGFLIDPLPVTRLDRFMPVLEGVMLERVGVESGEWGLDRARPLTTQERQAGLAEGTVLGAYRLLREIGYGGMSCVWLAERCDGLLKREVALKLPYEGPRRAQLAERFKRERHILATLTHPNIATLYDAGISASGRSYLAMEYVQGTMLTEHCDAAQLSVSERLTLFLQVLSAVEFAHTQLVLHRDLKPSNILVTDQGRVVLLDFGIAKLLAPDAEPGAPLTEMVARMLTPDYASPEHVAGKALGTTSDVYSLGVVLYELLTGARPFAKMKDESRRALEEAVLTQDPPRPSQSVLSDAAASARHSTPHRLARTLRGDLDTIILKALKKIPTQRYHSAGAFAQDISNYLQNLPVSARPDSTGYRTRRFITRYKWQVSAAAVTLLAIIGGGATAAWQARVAQSQARMAESQARAAARERDKAAALASRNGAMNDFMSLLISEAAFSANPVTVSEMLARSEQLAMADSSENSEDRAAILGMIAAMINNGSGDSSRSVALLERALVLVAGSRDSNLRARLTCDHAHMTAMGDSGKSEAAARALKHALENPDLDPLVASECLADLSGLSQFTRDGPAAVRYAMQSLDRFHDAGRQPVVDEAALIGQLAYAYFLDGQNRQADHYYQKALQKYAEAGRNYHPAANVLMNNWALVSSSAGVPKRALELYERGLSFVRSNDPGARPPPIMVANRARVLETIGRYAQARDAYNLALRLTRESKLVNFEVSCLLGLAAIAERFGDRATARRYLSEASGLTAPSWPADYPAVLRRLVLEGSLDIADGKLERARGKFDQVLARKVKTQTTISAGLGRAEVDLLSGDTAAAVAHSQDALSLATSLQGGLPYSCYAGLSWLMRGRALQARGEVVQARKAYETAITHLSNTVDADHPELLRARQLLASSGGTR